MIRLGVITLGYKLEVLTGNPHRDITGNDVYGV